MLDYKTNKSNRGILITTYGSDIKPVLMTRVYY